MAKYINRDYDSSADTPSPIENITGRILLPGSVVNAPGTLTAPAPTFSNTQTSDTTLGPPQTNNMLSWVQVPGLTDVTRPPPPVVPPITEDRRHELRQIFAQIRENFLKNIKSSPYWNDIQPYIDQACRQYFLTSNEYKMDDRDVETVLELFRREASPILAAKYVEQLKYPDAEFGDLTLPGRVVAKAKELQPEPWSCLIEAVGEIVQTRIREFRHKQQETQFVEAVREKPSSRTKIRINKSKNSEVQMLGFSKLIQTLTSIPGEDSRPKYLKEFLNTQNQSVAETYLDYYMYKQDYGKGEFMLYYTFWRDNLVALGTEGKFLIYVYNEKSRLWETEPRGIVKGLIRQFWHTRAEYIKVELRNGIKEVEDSRLGTFDKEFLFNFETALNTACGYGRQIEGSNKIMEAITPHLYQNSKFNSQGEKDIFLLKLNRNPDALPLGGGHTINLATGDIRSRQREDYWSYDTGFDYDHNVDITETNNYVLDIMGGDVEKMQFLQRVAGYCLTAHTRERKIFIFWGSGNNSKSTFLDLLRRAMGCIDVTDSKKGLYLEANKGLILEVKDNDPDKPSPAVMMTMGRRLVVCSELVTKDKVETGFCKKFASDGEMLSGRWLNCDPIQFENTAKLILQTNNKPAIPSDEEGRAFWNRILFIPFLEIYSEHPAENEKPIDRALILRLRNNLSAVLKWCIIGARDWYRQGLNPPQSVIDATAEYKAENDHVSQFITQDLDVSNSNTRSKPEELYAAYCNWRNDVNNRSAPHYSTHQFGHELGRRGYKSKVSNGIRYYQGINIKPKAKALLQVPGASNAVPYI